MEENNLNGAVSEDPTRLVSVTAPVPEAGTSADEKSGSERSSYVTQESVERRPLSKSSLWEFRKSPAHYLEYLFTKRESSPAMEFGSLVDCLVLTPELYEKRYVIMPKFDLRKKGSKEEQAEWMEANAGKEFIYADTLARGKEVRDALYANKKSAEYLAQITLTQRKLTWRDKETDLPMIGYVDFESRTAEPEFIGDLKVYRDANPDDFPRSAYNSGLHVQAAGYLEGFRRSLFRFPKFIFIVVEPEPPYGVAVYDKIDKDFLRLGQQELDDLRKRFRYCLDSGKFEESYNFKSVDGGHLLDLPGYAKTKIHE